MGRQERLLARRELSLSHTRHCEERLATKQSRFLAEALYCFAEPVIGPATSGPDPLARNDEAEWAKKNPPAAKKCEAGGSLYLRAFNQRNLPARLRVQHA
jgi:hypothetical protein